ncbi:MAG TPA: hypothetical protein P5123_05065 [Spirochaetota bacterium]|nr:hypothetical protein [Spirochaetota bacterium]
METGLFTCGIITPSSTFPSLFSGFTLQTSGKDYHRTVLITHKYRP